MSNSSMNYQKNKNSGLKPIEECQKFFDENPEFDSILRFLFQSTVYITREEILIDIENNINRWLSSRNLERPLYVTLKEGKIGSEYYFYHHFKHLLPKHTLIWKTFPDDIPDGSEILYIDDWSLSGVQMRDSYNRIFYTSMKEQKARKSGKKGYSNFDNMNKNNEDEDNENEDEDNILIERYPGKTLYYTVITSVMTDSSLSIFDISDYIEEENELTQNYFYNTKFECFYSRLATHFVDLLSEHVGFNVIESWQTPEYRFFQRFCDTNSLNKDQKLIPYDDYRYEYSIISSSPTFMAYAVHLEYKIANVYGSFPNIYNHCRFLAPSKEFMADTLKFFENIDI